MTLLGHILWFCSSCLQGIYTGLSTPDSFQHHYIGWYFNIRIGNFDEDKYIFTWGECCTEACKRMASVGVVKISNVETIRKWHDLFRMQEQFPLVSKDKDNLPYFLQANSDISGAIKKYGCKNIDAPGRKMMYFYIHDTITPPKRVGNMQDLAMLKNVETVKRVKKERLKGWMGKPNCLLQILWESGFIDPKVGARSYYSLGDRNNRYGNTMIDTSFPNPIRNCINFIE